MSALAVTLTGPGQANPKPATSAATVAVSAHDNGYDDYDDCDNAAGRLLPDGHIGDDGVKGMIKNFTGEKILVGTHSYLGCVLEPGHSVPYADTTEGDGKGFHPAKLYFSRDPKQEFAHRLTLIDSYVGRPDTSFSYGTPRWKGGESHWLRQGWREGEDHHIYWGDVHLWVKRETDGWKVPDEDFQRAAEGRDSDWAVFTVHVDRLPRNPGLGRCSAVTTTAVGSAASIGSSCVAGFRMKVDKRTATLSWDPMPGQGWQYRVSTKRPAHSHWRSITTTKHRTRVRVPRNSAFLTRIQAVKPGQGKRSGKLTSTFTTGP